MTTPPYDLHKSSPTTVEEPSWREPVESPERDEDAPPFEDAAERPEPEQPHERYWSESRVFRLGATFAFVAFSLLFVVKVAEAFPGVAWLPYLIGTIAYGVLAGQAWQRHHEAEQGARLRAEREANKRLRMSGGS